MKNDVTASGADVFQGIFTQQEAIPDAAIDRAVEVLKTGRLHRYNTVADEASEATELEEEFAAYMGTKHCLAVASGGYAMQLSMRALGITENQPVLTNAFTLSPVPGSIYAAGGSPVLVESTQDLVIDLNHLEERIKTSGSKVLMISHMRGHIVDMDALMALLERYDVTLLEDCAHTMGASWAGRKSGSFGRVGCFSTQTYKHINSGEGGLLVTDDSELFARAVLLSGSYMLYGRNGTAPDESYFSKAKYQTPNCSGRMDNLRAAILRPQLKQLDDNARRWNERYDALANRLATCEHLRLPVRPPQEQHVPSSLQFVIADISRPEAESFLAKLLERNVELKWFGRSEPHGFTSQHSSWEYVEKQSLPTTDALLAGLFDIRLPLTFSVEDCDMIGRIIVETLNAEHA